MPRLKDAAGKWINNQQSDFWAMALISGSCWLWQGQIERNGYGRAWFKGKRRSAHRLAYELTKGQIPHGLTIDHLCRNRACINPAHLEAVSMRTNVLRGDTITAANARKTHCPRGHVYDRMNSQGRRICRTCGRNQLRRYRMKGKCR